MIKHRRMTKAQSHFAFVNPLPHFEDCGSTNTNQYQITQIHFIADKAPSLWAKDQSQICLLRSQNFGLQICLLARLQIYLKSMKIVAFALSLLVIATAFQVQKSNLAAQPALQGINWPFTICGTGKWTIESVVFGSIPSRNLNDNIDMIGTAKESVSFSKVDLDVKLNGVFLHAQSADLVASFDSGDAVAYRYKNFIPSFAPAGTYTLTFNFLNQSSKPQGCVSMSFKL